jgi:hypothetical protein
LAALEGQLRLTREDFDARLRSARPQLEATVLRRDPAQSLVKVIYRHGADPATSLQVWARVVHAGGESTYLHASSPETMTPGTSTQLTLFPIRDPDLSADMLRTFAELKLDNDARAVAVTWRAMDGTEGRWGAWGQANWVYPNLIWPPM